MNNSDWISIYSASTTLLMGVILALVGYLWSSRSRQVSTFMKELSDKLTENAKSISTMSTDIAVLKTQSEAHEKFTEQVLKPELDDVAQKVGELAIGSATMSRELNHLNEKIAALANQR
jgi:uncharacterized protein YoxC